MPWFHHIYWGRADRLRPRCGPAATAPPRTWGPRVRSTAFPRPEDSDPGSPAHVSAVPAEGLISAPIQTIARLQRTNCRLDPRMTPPCLAEFHSGLLLLTLGLNVACLGQARLLHQFRQLALILRRMEAAIERRTSDSTVQSLLHLFHLLHQNLAVFRPTRQDRIVADEARTILDYQDAVTELERLRNLATYDQLSVRLEQTEEFFAVVDPSPSSTRRRARSQTWIVILR